MRGRVKTRASPSGFGVNGCLTVTLTDAKSQALRQVASDKVIGWVPAASRRNHSNPRGTADNLGF